MTTHPDPGAQWRAIETHCGDMAAVIGMNAKGDIYRTWFFAPSGTTRNWHRIPGNAKWRPTHWMPIPPLTMTRLPPIDEAAQMERM